MAVHNTSSAIRAGAAGAAASGFYTHIIENSLRVAKDVQTISWNSSEFVKVHQAKLVHNVDLEKF